MAMEQFQTKEELQQRINTLKKEGNSIGFVPTMGALHEGHLSLINCSNEGNDITVVSIFVNPTQFNQREDYEKYPRNIQEDLHKLQDAGCEIAFIPEESEMYPEEDTRDFDFGYLQEVLEGYHRPGHFNGVAQIVSKLFDAVRPHRAYFGEKDFQQLAIIRKLVEQLNMDIDVIGCPIIREKDGLAMSSRNQRLNSTEREVATSISKILFDSVNMAEEMNVEEVKNWVINQLNKNPHIDVEYFEIVQEKTFQPIKKWEEQAEMRGCIAAWVGDVRLIDNVKYYF